MRTELNRTTFFTRKEFEDLKLPKLDYKKYKEFIHEWNLLAAEEVLENIEGYYLPLDFGHLRITKSKPKKELITTHSIVTGQGVEKNRHSLGFIYRVTWDARYSFYTSRKKLFGIKMKSFLSAFRFKPHRMNIKRPLAQIIKNNIRDYAKPN